MASAFTLEQLLALAGTLDDTPGPDTARERFRKFLSEHVQTVGEVRDYIEECLRTPGAQHQRALQDLVTFLGRFLQFEITYGRYQGVQNQIGFDGLWQSLGAGFAIVIETKTTEVYAIKTSALLGYMNALISAQQISDEDHALGLYVVAKVDPEINQLEHAIIAEKRTHQLRLISVDALLSIAELMSEYDISHANVLEILRPSGPRVDAIVDLITRVVAQGAGESESVAGGAATAPVVQALNPSESGKTGAGETLAGSPKPEEEVQYWLTPLKDDENGTATGQVEKLVGKDLIYSLGERTPGRKHLKPGDRICFYATTIGVVADAEVLTRPVNKPHPSLRHPEDYPWTFQLTNPRLYISEPVVVDAELRGKLEAFKDRDINGSWSWYVQTTRRVTPNDFKLLTGQGAR